MIVGRVTGLYGVGGWVKVTSYTEPRENIFRYTPWYMQFGPGEEPRPLCVAEGRAQGKALVAHLEGCEGREAAAGWVGADIAVDRAQFPAPPEGQYYWADLIGLRVLTLEGVELGVIDYLMETGANDVLVVKGDRERLVPYVKDGVVRSIDRDQGVLWVDWDPEF